MKTRISLKPVVYGMIVASALAMASAQAWAANGIISKTPLGDGNYCHLQFPAIVPSTLGTEHPQLKDPSSGDIIDYYGSCNHNPVGKNEVQSQEQDQWVRGLRNLAEEPFD